ncbi:MAG TPA: alkaline phosphatase family protein [Verrucomicrobiae bacterium]|nr:alkaline phosphatase family protein [Verrucomicrobiae bacterium]
MLRFGITGDPTTVYLLHRFLRQLFGGRAIAACNRKRGGLWASAAVLLQLFCANGSAAANLTNIQTVFLVMMENHDWSLIKGDPECPFINNVLLPMASYANNYRSPAGVHPSEANYLWLEAGTNFGIFDDFDHAIDSTNHLVTLLQGAGVSWRAYQESITGTNCPLYNSYPYAPRHCPMLFFNDIRTNGLLCMEQVRPYWELAADLTNNAVARYNYVTPNLTNDMHDFNPGFASARAAGDHWLSMEIPKIMNSAAYTNNGAIFLTWDEGTDFSDGPMGMIVLSPLAKGHGYHNSIPYTHSATLRTFQEIFGVRPFLGDAQNSRSLADLFNVFSLDVFPGTEPGVVQLIVNGMDNEATVILERSGNLLDWQPFATNIVAGTPPLSEQTVTNQHGQFYRAVISP